MMLMEAFVMPKSGIMAMDCTRKYTPNTATAVSVYAMRMPLSASVITVPSA